MSLEKMWPQPGQKLMHYSRNRKRNVVAEVVEVDRKNEMVSVRVGKKVYPSLSAAARSITKKPVNGWIYWGLRKQQVKRK